MRFFRKKKKKDDPTLLEIFALEVERKAQERASRIVKSLNGAELLAAAFNGNDDEFLLTGGRRRITDFSTTQSVAEKYQTVVWVYICVNARARNIASVPLIIVDPETQEKIDHPFQEVLSQPGKKLTMPGLLENTLISLDTCGKALWEIVRNQKKDIIEFNFFDGWRVNALPGKRTDKYGADEPSGFICSLDEKDRAGKPLVVEFAPEEVVYFRYRNPLKVYDGLSPISLARMQIQADTYAAFWNKTFFEEGTEPSGVLETDKPLMQDEAEWIREQFEHKHKGKPHRVAVLPNAVKYRNTTLSHTDMDFLNQQRNVRNIVAGIYGVPLPVLGFYESDTSSGRSAGIQEYMMRFWTQTLIPVMRLNLLPVLNLSLGTALNINFGFDLDAVEALQGNQKEMAASAKLMVGTGLSWNEIRAKAYGEPPVSGLDWIPVPANIVPAGETPGTMEINQVTDGLSLNVKKKLLTAGRYNYGNGLLVSKR